MVSKMFLPALAAVLAAGAYASAASSPPAQMPPGHPDISTMLPQQQPAATKGTLAIRVYQGTQGAAAIGAEPVTVELIHQSGQVLKRIDVKLDDRGTAMLKDLPLDLPFYPIVRITHAGLDYEAQGEIMDPTHSAQQVDLPVYEVTNQEPAWHIEMRHAIVEPMEGKLHVTEVLAVKNPTDRTWRGREDASGKRCIMSIDLPPDLERVDSAVPGVVSGNKLMIEGPMQAGDTRVKFEYVAKLKDGKAELPLVAPAAVTRMAVLGPDDPQFKVEGLGTVSSHGEQAMYYGENIEPGQLVKVTVEIAPVAKTEGNTAFSSAPKIVAIIGGGLVLLVGAGIMLKKRK